MTNKSPNDREPVDAAEVAKLLVKHQGAILGYILACLRSHADADDVFQDVSMAAVELRDQLHDVDGFLPWVRQIARYRVLKFVEKPNRLTPMSPELISQLAEVANEVDVDGRRGSRVGCLNACIDDLPTESRRMILMRYSDAGHSVQDISSSVNRSVQATYALLKRTRAALRECVTRKLAEVKS